MWLHWLLHAVLSVVLSKTMKGYWLGKCLKSVCSVTCMWVVGCLCPLHSTRGKSSPVLAGTAVEGNPPDTACVGPTVWWAGATVWWVGPTVWWAGGASLRPKLKFPLLVRNPDAFEPVLSKLKLPLLVMKPDEVESLLFNGSSSVSSSPLKSRRESPVGTGGGSTGCEDCRERRLSVEQ